MKNLLSKWRTNLRGKPAGARRFFQAFAVVVLLMGFVAGYGGMSSMRESCAAVIPPIGAPPVLGSICTCGFGVSPCAPIGSTVALTIPLEAALYTALVASVTAIENYIGAVAVDTMVEDILVRLNKMELDWIQWWQTMWFYNQRPAMQDMTEQVNVATVDQTKNTAQAIDAQEQGNVVLEQQKQEVVNARETKPDEEGVCTAATNVGGMARQSIIGRAMRRGWQDLHTADGLNKENSPGATGVMAVLKQHDEDFRDTFCDPQDNGGNNNCGASQPAFYNADTQVTKRLYNAMTIPVDKDPAEEVALEHIMTNMLGRPKFRPMEASVVTSTAGIESWMMRRSYLARKNALGALPRLMASWRMPGGQVSTWTQSLREGAGINIDDISDNPSYMEIVNAVTVDRFNSGQYALDKVSDSGKQQLEKLTLTAFYLMQLRDYFELLERTALALSVQVAVMAEDYQMSKPNMQAPK